MRGPRLGGEQWQRLVEALARSGLGVREFARRRGLSASQLTYWKYKRRAPRRTRPTAFAEVRLIEDGVAARPGEFVLELPGARVRVPPGFDSFSTVWISARWRDRAWRWRQGRLGRSDLRKAAAPAGSRRPGMPGRLRTTGRVPGAPR
jgi:hypothetical protein